MFAASAPFLLIVAQASAGSAQASPPAGLTYLPILFMGVIFYFLLIRPQQKRAKEQATLISSIKSGDRVVTSGGLHGIVANARDVSDKTVLVKFAENVKMEVDKSAITTVSKANGEPDVKAALVVGK